MGLHDFQHWESVTQCWDWLIPLLGTEGSRVTQHGITRFPALGIRHTVLGLADTFIGNGRIPSDATWDYTISSIGNTSHNVGISSGHDWELIIQSILGINFNIGIIIPTLFPALG